MSLFNPTAYTAVPTGSPTWTANAGYTTNGSSSYIKTAYTPSINGVNFLLNSAMIAYYTRTNVGYQTGVDCGAYDGANFDECYSAYTGTGMGTYINNATGLATLNAATQGLFSHARTSSTTVTQTINGTQIATGTHNSVALCTQQIYIGNRNDNGTPDLWCANQYALFITASGGLNQVTLNSAVNLLMTNLGAHY
jgi:hypothetical protein